MQLPRCNAFKQNRYLINFSKTTEELKYALTNATFLNVTYFHLVNGYSSSYVPNYANNASVNF